MAHFAELDTDGIVTQVVVVANDVILVDGTESEAAGVDFLELLYGHRRWKQTSYNATIRKNFAGIGYRYDSLIDAFVPPQPWPSWRLNTETAQWSPPTPCPQDGSRYDWHEPSLSWIAIN